MMSSRHIGAWMMFLFLFSGSIGAQESCIQCHTSDSTMKSLFVPPESHGAEEGEG